MDKLSVQVLKHIAKTDDSIDIDDIVESLGAQALRSLDYLETDGYIKSGRIPVGSDQNHNPILRSDGLFSITSKGLNFLEERPGKIYDIWSTRVLAIWGAVTGTIAIVTEIVLHFLQ